MDVTYIRYQDDLIVLCKTKRQLNRCRRKMMDVLHERRLKLSRKKSRMGCVSKGFHFLGMDYPGTQTQGETKVATGANDKVIVPHEDGNILHMSGG
jgi:RNA-directed DNA polymerase